MLLNLFSDQMVDRLSDRDLGIVIVVVVVVVVIVVIILLIIRYRRRQRAVPANESHYAAAPLPLSLFNESYYGR